MAVLQTNSFKKGQHAVLKYDGTDLLKHEKSSTMALKANTADVSSKSDTNPMYDNQEFTNYTFNFSAEGILDDVKELLTLVNIALGVEAKTAILDDKQGSAFVTSADFDFPGDGSNATVSMSLEGTGAVTEYVAQM